MIVCELLLCKTLVMALAKNIVFGS